MKPASQLRRRDPHRMAVVATALSAGTAGAGEKNSTTGTGEEDQAGAGEK